MSRRLSTVALAVILLGAACSGGGEPSSTTTAEPVAGEGVLIPPGDGARLRNQRGYEFPPPPAVDDGPPAAALVEAIDTFFASLDGVPDLRSLQAIGDSGDARAAWLMSDLLRFVGPGNLQAISLQGFEQLTGVTLGGDPVATRSPWQSVTDHLIAWDLPALPGYREWKRRLFTLIEPKWEPFFADEDSAIDWRLTSWGGVPLDDRPLGTTTPCPLGCIPALDDPAVTDAAGGDWYPDDALVFALTVNGESRAYPKNIMEVHEMVNDTLGGRRLGIPYCTLCGSAQAYFTDRVPDGVEIPVLRTSGLLSRSNKVMFDLNTFSVFDTFTGEAVSGPLQDAGVVLEQASVVTSTWADWKAAHPDTTIVAEDGGIGRSYPADPLRGRDDDGPIFPMGDVDERLPVQEQVLGVIAEDGSAVAFPVAASRAHLDAGGTVAALGVTVVADGSGIRAVRADGSDASGHQAFWFAWSQFHPDTLLWAPPG